MMPDTSNSTFQESGSESRRDWWTIPNLLCVIRLLGAPGLVALAFQGRSDAFVLWYLFLALTDWLDGKLAILLSQRSKIGPRLDTASDVTMYACLLLGFVWLESAFLWTECWWIVAAVGTYVATVAVCLIKFRSWPSYHTRAAKIGWFLVAASVVSLLLDWSSWPFRMAMGLVTLANAETMAMSLLLRHKLTDVSTIYHALKRDGWRQMTS